MIKKIITTILLSLMTSFIACGDYDARSDYQERDYILDSLKITINVHNRSMREGDIIADVRLRIYGNVIINDANSFARVGESVQFNFSLPYYGLGNALSEDGLYHAIITIFNIHDSNSSDYHQIFYARQTVDMYFDGSNFYSNQEPQQTQGTLTIHNNSSNGYIEKTVISSYYNGWSLESNNFSSLSPLSPGQSYSINLNEGYYEIMCNVFDNNYYGFELYLSLDIVSGQTTYLVFDGDSFEIYLLK